MSFLTSRELKQNVVTFFMKGFQQSFVVLVQQSFISIQCRIDRPLYSSLFVVHSVTQSSGSDSDVSYDSHWDWLQGSFNPALQSINYQELKQLCLKEQQTGVCPVVFKKTRVFIDVYNFNTSEGRHSGLDMC